MLEYVINHAAMILAVLLGISEALALIPAVQANSVFQLIVNILKKVAELVKKPQA